MSFYICLGLLFGVAIGSSINHLGICMIIGILFGIAYGMNNKDK